MVSLTIDTMVKLTVGGGECKKKCPAAINTSKTLSFSRNILTAFLVLHFQSQNFKISNFINLASIHNVFQQFEQFEIFKQKRNRLLLLFQIFKGYSWLQKTPKDLNTFLMTLHIASHITSYIIIASCITSTQYKTILKQTNKIYGCSRLSEIQIQISLKISHNFI